MTVYTQDIKVPSPQGSGKFDTIGGVAFGPGGTLAVLSQPPTGAFVTVVNADSSFHSTFGLGQLGLVRDVTVDDGGTVYVVEQPESGSPKVSRYQLDGGFVGTWTPSQLYGLSITFDGSGLLNIGGDDGIHRYHPDGTAAGSYGIGGMADGLVAWAAGLSYDASANRMWVADMFQNYVEEYVPGNDTQLVQFGGRGSGPGQFDNGEPTGSTFYGPNRLAVDAQGHVYAADPFASRLIKFSSSGAYLGEFSFGGARWIGAVTVGPDGRIFVGLDADVLIVCPF
jgi:hypothetical protein